MSVPFLQLPGLSCSDCAASHAGAWYSCLAVKMLPHALIVSMATLAGVLT